jgi:catechol 2,3-dioxygenase-like lactoylglutathione lyase family enzyme
MNATPVVPALVIAALAASLVPATGQTTVLPPPAFHHLHLNSVDPDAAIDFYTRQFPTTAKSSWGGLPALKSPNDVLILFSKVAAPPKTSPQTAIWHFGWHAVDSRRSLETYKGRPDVKLIPLYTGDEGDTVLISSDTWPGPPGVLGLSKAEIAEARAKGVQPARTRGFAYMQGPDGAIIEFLGNFPAERMNHVHMFQEHPFCAQLWYQKHLNAKIFQDRTSSTPLTEANCQVPRSPDPTWPAMEREGLFRAPRAAVEFSDVALTWYPRQGSEPLASTRGHVYDHIGLSVADLDAWMAKLKRESVTILEEPYRLGDTRAVMIEGPSREALELVEAR